MNLKVKIIIPLILITLSLGCINKNAADTNITPMNTTTPQSTSVGVPELKIMSVATDQATADMTTVILKVKNKGNDTAKEVYAGVIRIQSNLDWLYNRYPDKNNATMQVAYSAIINGDSYLDTGYYAENTNDNLTLSGKLISQDYIGDILPDRDAVVQLTIPTKDYDGSIKMAVWTGDKKEYSLI